ncbi:enediyne polyketide synthase [Actinoplanes italicus]|uniref:Enediyne polyketide synthase n=2 Tax=Actinoplanes italicus TaxID=113567 RepID=A0A2T0K8I6_9ACTN|nr:enediyne polyketide synthase [Actinoplanes italicus]
MACRYPDATSPKELFDNAIAGRRAFRRLPDVRMRLEDYWDPDPRTPDRFYASNAAVIDSYQFDRVAYKVAGSTYRSTDLTHWLALDVAAGALADAGFPMAEGLPRDRTGVIIGNTLTGEFSRANQLRLRWPYVQRTVSAVLRERGFGDDDLGMLLDDLEQAYKSPFPAIDEDTLAGGLSNTIAGRICNHFDLQGGGYTVDGACSSSLLSVATACKALVEGELDVAVAGGVDLSIDPFEIIGFAKTMALATGEMRVYDRGANGFWPGEGCGMVVLMREDDARRGQHRIYSTIAGWGISSDGRGGITRPETRGYHLALNRAYAQAGFGIDTVPLFEGHGTGTKVGDDNELTALNQNRQAAGRAAPAAISSVKAMIGHTKAAAGIAGLIKASMALRQEVIPPAIGCHDPHEVFSAGNTALRVVRKAEPWPDGQPVRAGVTAMGFGGINTHLVLDNGEARRPARYGARVSAIAAGAQDAELLLFDALTPQELRERLERAAAFVPTVSYAQLSDLASALHGDLRDLPWRAAVVVRSPADAVTRLEAVITAIDSGETQLVSSEDRVFLGQAGDGRIGFLFPGQGSGRGTSGGALRRRFTEADEVYRRAALPGGGDTVATEVAQPRIVTGSLAGQRVLTALGIDATVAVGHSLGELTALQWAGAVDAGTVVELAAQRGRTMAEHSSSGTMASMAADAEQAQRLIDGLPLVIAGHNGPNQTVVAGAIDAVEEGCRRAGEAGVTASRLAVSHAFHSPLVAGAADAFGSVLGRESFGPLQRRVVSTVTGETLDPDTDLGDLLRRQITEPVLFSQAVALAAKDVDLLVEVGPGQVLSGLARAVTDVPAVALDTDDESSAGLLRVVAAAFVTGGTNVEPTLFHGRLLRPLTLDTTFTFFASPCEQAPAVPAHRPAGPAAEPAAPAESGPATGGAPVAEELRRLAAERAELPLESVNMDSRLLDDLHLSSITVGQLVNTVAQGAGIPPSQVPANYATATLGELAETLESLRDSDRPEDTAAPVAGAAEWVRAWRIDLDERSAPAVAATGDRGSWQVHSPGGTPLAGQLKSALERARVGGGVLVWLPEDCSEADLAPALAGARAAATGSAADRFVLVQHGRGAAGLAKTLHLEAPHVRTTVVDIAPEPDAVDRIVAEVAATSAFAEVRYTADGVRQVPVLRPMPVRAGRTEAALTSSDVLLVTGGGKGITAECALTMAEDSGCRLALVGRSDPAADPELRGNLTRITERGVDVRYARADVTDPAQIRAAIDELTGLFGGPVTAILHGSGRNEPASLVDVHPDMLRDTLAPKVDGLRNVLDAVDGGSLRLLVALGSIIGRSGLRGEAHYSIANEWLGDLVARHGAANPDCRTLVLEWSVWSGVGMGERLSVVEALSRQGVTPITPDQGVAVLRRLLEDPDTPPAVVISGRTEGIHTVERDQPELPLLRFVDRTLLRYHEVELVAETELNAGTDPYLADHLLDGSLLFPAVFGMEAMAQVTAALTGWTEPPIITGAEFARPIVVPPDGSTTIRIAAVRTGDDTVDVAIQSAETGFSAEHFRARLRRRGGDTAIERPADPGSGLPPVPLDPATDLYDGLLFQGDRFQRLRGYRRAAARHVDATVEALPDTGWFAGFLPGRLILGDPGVRDALMHGNQVCVPDATLLPVGVDEIIPAGSALDAGGELRMYATERSHDGDDYLYDVVLCDASGQAVERWSGLHLRAVRKRDSRGPWPAPLLGPYLERTLEDVTGLRASVVVEPDDDGDDTGEHVATRRRRTARAAGRALGHPAEVHYRADGRPQLPGDRTLTAAHGAGLTLAVIADGPAGCDLEPVASRARDDWQALLGRHHDLAARIAEACAEPFDVAATRVWAAGESLRKAGRSTDAPIMLAAGGPPGWVLLTSGDARIGVLSTSVRGGDTPVVLAVLAEVLEEQR